MEVYTNRIQTADDEGNEIDIEIRIELKGAPSVVDVRITGEQLLRGITAQLATLPES